MKTIEEYIEQSKTMNYSVDSFCGSKCYDFGDLVLIEYPCRPCEEEVMREVNIKNSNGINTPKHLAFKFRNDDKNDICWVLQEKVLGVSFREYTDYNYNKIDNEKKGISKEMWHIKKAEEVLNFPDEHYAKLVSDVIQLSNMGIELKHKNVFYDKDKGFYFIDLIYVHEFPKKDTIDYYYQLSSYYNSIVNYLFKYFLSYECKSSNEIKALIEKIIVKTFTNLKSAIPEFDKYKRWLLRALDDDLDKYIENGYGIENLDLTEEEKKEYEDELSHYSNWMRLDIKYKHFKKKLLLTDKEIEIFDELVDKILYEAFNWIASNEKSYSTTCLYIGYYLDRLCILSSWLYHKNCADDYTSRDSKKEKFKENVLCRFNEIILNDTSYNENILRAKEEIENSVRKSRNRRF